MDENTKNVEELRASYKREAQLMDLAGRDRLALVAGQRVEFDVVQGPPGPRAVCVRVLVQDGTSDGVGSFSRTSEQAG